MNYSSIDNQLKVAWKAYQNQDLKRSWQLCQLLLKSNPNDVPVLDLSSRVTLAMGQAKLALTYAEQALTFDRPSFTLLSQQAFCLLRLKCIDETNELLKHITFQKLTKAGEFDTLGNLYSLMGDQENALKHFQNATELDPNRGHYWLNVALSAQSLGNMQLAESSFNRSLELTPSAETYLHRSRLRKQTIQNNHTEELVNRLSINTNSWRENVALGFALAKEFEDLCDYEKSFSTLQKANHLRRKHMEYDVQSDIATIGQIIEQFDAEFFKRNVVGYENKEPIFIVGLPRTGTTLVERIIGSHSDVYAAGELNNFAECLTEQVLQFKPKNRQEMVHFSAQINFQNLGKNYIESTRPFTSPSLRFIDKLPLNFLYCGLIAEALPNAKIVHLQRNPMDSCYAIYKTLFKQAYPYSYDLKELGSYYLAYQRLMKHWNTMLPNRIHTISYENLVTNQEEETRSLLTFCELEWQQQSMEFYKNKEPSLTASLSQVRQPVYKSSISKWKNYSEQLAELELFLSGVG